MTMLQHPNHGKTHVQRMLQGLGPQRIPHRDLDTVTATVFSGRRTVQAPDIQLPETLKPNTRLQMDGLKFLELLPKESIPVAFLDPQYRGVLDKLSYGNEGQQRGQRRCALQQMTEFHLCEGFKTWFDATALDVVDLINWDKKKLGMGYRSRRITEYCVVLQKQPRKAKGVWKIHNIPDTWREKAEKVDHPHNKPLDLQGELICAVSDEGDYVIDPAAGSFSVMEAAQLRRRNFLGCDLEG